MTHLRKMMLEELQRRNYSQNTTRYYIRTVEDFARRFNRSTRPFGSSAHSRIPSRVVPEAEVVTGYRLDTPGGSALLLRQDSQEVLEHRRDSLSEKGTSPADDSQPGRSRATHRRRLLLPSSHHTDDALCHRSPERRADASESQRHRQQEHGDSHPRRQGAQRSRCHAQPKVARRTSGHIGTGCDESQANGCFLATATTAVISPSIRKPSGTPAIKPPSGRASRKGPSPHAAALPSPLICSKQAPICAPFRSC